MRNMNRMKSEIDIRDQDFRMGAAAVRILADDSMVIGGGIFPSYKSGQEGELRASAIVLEKGNRVCIISCDVLMMQRDILDDVCLRIERETGILSGNILISSTHTHHAPTTATVHGYERDQLFSSRVKEAMVSAAIKATGNLGEAACRFSCGRENTVGQNSRVILTDGSVLWVPSEPQYASLEPTGVHDPDLPVCTFEMKDGSGQVLLFSHGCHNIGARDPDKRSPGFYGLAAQELEKENGGMAIFLSGASGSSHNLKLTTEELVSAVKTAVTDTMHRAGTVEISGIVSMKSEFEFGIRYFQEKEEDQAVSDYCHKMRVDWCDHPQDIVNVFRDMRKSLVKHQGEVRKSWLQVILMGDIAWVAVPGELFGTLAREIKNRSPFHQTYIIGYANDHIGYIPDSKAFELGGYQIWTGYHSLVKKGTGEQIVEQALAMLNKLKKT